MLKFTKVAKTVGKMAVAFKPDKKEKVPLEVPLETIALR